MFGGFVALFAYGLWVLCSAVGLLISVVYWWFVFVVLFGCCCAFGGCLVATVDLLYFALCLLWVGL